MKQLVKKMIVAVPALLFGVGAFAQAPGWNVNPMDYQYSMTVSAVASKNCALLADTGNVIAAFEGEMCRGIARTGNRVNDRYVASLVIYSNTASGGTLRFKVYHKSSNEVLELKNILSFEENATLGYAGAPYELYTNRAPSGISIGTTLIPVSAVPGSVIADFYATDPDSADQLTLRLSAGEGSTHNSFFSISNNKLVLAQTLPEGQNMYSIRVSAQDLAGCKTDSVITLTRVQTALNELWNEKTFRIFPVPAQEKINLQLALYKRAAVTIRLLTLQGKEVKTLAAKHVLEGGMQAMEISLGNIIPGAYLLQVYHEEQLLNRKIIIY